jgi:hypothetical protein
MVMITDVQASLASIRRCVASRMYSERGEAMLELITGEFRTVPPRNACHSPSAAKGSAVVSSSGKPSVK